MKKLIRDPRLLVLFVVVIPIFSAVGWFAWKNRVSSLHDLRVYHAMQNECHPVWRDLNERRITAGQDLDEVIRKTLPLKVEQYGRFVLLVYQPPMSFTGVSILAKDGRLICATASSCTWRKTFFDTMQAEDREEYNRAYDTHWRPHREKIFRESQLINQDDDNR